MKSLIYLILLLFCTNIYSQTINVSGNINSNTTWSADTVKVTGNIYVNSGVILKIDPGVYIEFQDFYYIFVLGLIQSNGMINDSITYTVKDTTGFYQGTFQGGWQGIQISNNTGNIDSSSITYCKFLFCKYIPILVISNSQLKITNNYFFNNVGEASIECSQSSPIICNNIIYNNGITLLDNSNPEIFKNIFNNCYNGIYAQHSSPHIYQNIITSGLNGILLLTHHRM